jgi:hypothetical protein
MGTSRIGEGVVGTVAVGVVAFFGVAVGVDPGIDLGVSSIFVKLSGATMLWIASMPMSATNIIVTAISIVFLRVFICKSVPKGTLITR